MPEDRDINFNITLRPWQHKACELMKRFNLLLVARQSGKTVLSLAQLVASAIADTQPDPRYAYVDPYLKQARRVAGMYLKQMTADIPGAKYIESHGLVKFSHNGAEIELEGADTPDSLRGTYLDGVVLDEFEDMKPDVWEAVTLPKVLSRGGWVIIQGTLHGVGNLSQQYFKVKEDPEWYTGNFTALETGYPGNSELEIARKNMSARRFAQEYMNDLSAGSADSGLSLQDVYEANARILPPSAYQHMKLIMGVDIGRGGDDPCAICFRQGKKYEPIVVFPWKGDVETANTIAAYAEERHPSCINVDDTGGYGAMTVAKLKAASFNVNGINFASSASNERYRNKRVEMWWQLWQHIKDGSQLPIDNELATDLTCVHYDHDNAKNVLYLESKEEIKKRIGRSVDRGDAAALTHAVKMNEQQPGEYENSRMIQATATRRYNPKLAALKRSEERRSQAN